MSEPESQSESGADSPEPRFPFVALEVHARRSDELAAVLFELGATGVEVRDDTTMYKGPGGDDVRLVASFDTLPGAEAARAALVELDGELAPEVDEVVGDAWRDKYKEHFKPFALTEHLVVAPPWEPYEATAGERVLIMDPGRAFGTGLHATTSMVAQLLDARRDTLAGARVLDVGTGSGILGLVALAFGAGSVVAIDNDREVIEVAAENAQRNGFEMHVSDIALEHVDGAFDVVVANIRSEVLIGMTADLAARARSGALLVLSGILGSEADGVKAAFTADFDVLETTRREEATDAWVAIALSRKPA